MEKYRMRKIGIRSAKPTTDGGFLPASDDDQEVWFKREWRLITLLAIMIVAFVIRFIFAYGVSAGSDFALSGGTGASSHAHIIESILNGSFAFTDPALNYPYGAVNIYPPLMDFILAGVAGIVSLFGISAGTAAAGTLAFAAPIFAALTCWPVYLIGRKMFDDEKIGLLAALLYAFFALLIMTTAFSNGTEYAFIGFLFAFMVYFLLRAMEDCDKLQPQGFRAMLKEKAVLKNVLIAGILFAMIALSWNQFRIILIMLVFMMVAQALIDRFRSKTITPTVGIYSAVIMLGIIISAPYYILAGLWDLVFSGPFIIAVMAVVLTVFFSKTAERSWVLMIPVTLIIAGVILAVMAFVAGDLFSAVVNGNTVYASGLMSDLVSSTRHTSISSMAAFFGWVTVWLPLVMFLYMVYKYRKNMDSRKYTFTMWWIFLMFCIGWYSTSYAVLAGAGFAVASAAMILMIIRTVDLKTYFSDMRGNGVKYALRKALKPVPLVTTIALAALIVAPNVVYAVDASIPTNSEGDGYFGGLGYTIMTDDVNSINKMWNEFSGVDKDGAVVAWLGYSTNAVTDGGFDSVTDPYGGGTSAMSAILLANSSAAATAAMAIRLMLANDIESFRAAISGAGLDYEKVKGYIEDPSTAIQEVKDNVDVYVGINPNVTEENALYLVLTNYMTTTISEPELNSLYGDICSISGESIRYVSVDRSMLPLYYNDGSYFSNVAYLGSYTMDAYGAPVNYFSYNTSTGYTTYKDAMYDSFFWKSLIGMSPAAAGYTSSTAYLNALALSDGSVKANPGYGLANYKVVYWHVMYNPDSSATGASDGWEEMDAFEAIALQEAEGGLINYVNGVVLMEYDPTTTNSVSGTVNYTSSTGIAGAEGIQVSVFVETDYDDSGISGYVKKSTVFTDSQGRYTICVPTEGNYYVVFSSGATGIATGSIIETLWGGITNGYTLNIPATTLQGSVVVGDSVYTETSYVTIKGAASGKTYQVDVINGNFSFTNVIPDVYTATVYSPSGTTINTKSLTVHSGMNQGAQISATSGTITVTVTDEFGAKATSGTIIAMDSKTGATFNATVDNGQAKITVVPSTYTIFASGNKASISNPSVTVESNGSKTASLTVYDARNITVSGAPSGTLVSLMSYGFISSSSVSNTFAVPTSGGSTNETYTAYAVNGNTVYYGVSSGNSISLTGSTAYSVKGVLKDVDGENLSGTVSFINAAGATFIFTSNEDGEFNVKLPAGTYTMYAYGSSSTVVKTVTISGDTDMEDVSTQKSRDITITLSYRTNMSSGSTKGIGFVDMILTMTINDVEYRLVVKTDTSGKAVFHIPTGTAAKVTCNEFDTTEFHMDTQTVDVSSGSGSYSTTWTLAASQTSDSKKYVKTVSVSNNVPVEITLYNSSSTKYDITSSPKQVIPGQYTAVISGSTGYYFKGTIYIYPGQSGNLNIDVTNVVKVELNASTTDEISVTATDEEKGDYFVDPDNDLIYYLERGKSFYFTAVSGEEGSTEKIAYASVSNITSPTPPLNLSDKSEKATITGYTGVTASGTVDVKIGDATIPFTVKDGAFELVVPTGVALQLKAKLTKTIGSDEFTYAGTASMAAEDVKDEAVLHFPSFTTGQTSTLEMSGSNFSFSNGVGSFNLTIRNTGDYVVTYIVKAGSAWVLDKEYTVTVNPGQSSSVTVTGYYDADLVGAGNENLSVIVTSINGDSKGTYVVDSTAFSSSGPRTETFVDVSGTEKAFVDAVSGYEYLYAVTITNNDNFLKKATINATISDSSGLWTLVFSDENGGNIYAGPYTYDVKGYGATVIYIKLLCRDASSTSVPSVNVTINMAGETLNSNSSSVTFSGSTATFTMSAQPAEMESEDMSASGDNIYNEQSQMPAISFVLIALCILALIAMIWFGIKKGVFVRRK